MEIQSTNLSPAFLQKLDECRNCSPENPVDLPERAVKNMLNLVGITAREKKELLRLIANKSIVILPDSMYTGGNHNGY